MRIPLLSKLRFAATLIALAIAGTLMLSACGEGDSDRVVIEPVEPPNKAALASLSGDILIDGSSTVYPISQAAAEEFARYSRRVRITVGISGTGGGFKRFCSDETDISDASRPISPTEVEACAKAGVKYIELPVAYDGIAVVVNKDNDFVGDCITKSELNKIWSVAAQGTVTNWSQVRSSWPDRSLNLFGPGTDSGTFEYFTEAINGKAKESRGDYQASEDDNVLVQGVSGDQNALGYFGFAYYIENQDKLKLLQVDDDNGKCIAPSFEAIENASYQPLARPLFIYVKETSASKPAVKEFVNFYLGKSLTPLIPSREVGYVKLPDAAYEAITERFNAGITGTLFPNGSEVGATLDRYLRS